MRRKALKAAFPCTIPIMTGFIFLGASYGIYTNASGFSFVYPLIYEYAHLWRFAGKGTRWKKFYLIYGMCDETFSVNYTADIPEDVDKGWFMFFVTLLNQFYWVASATAGGIIGSLLKINTDGISFVMTAMFVVIFMDQWLKEDNHISSLIGLGVSHPQSLACWLFTVSEMSM